jgi:ubiquinone/menaquinone biosynthesis C-methylase UbiE
MPTLSPLRRKFVELYYGSLKVLCPGLKNSQFAYRDALTDVVRPGTTWLDLGCGHQFFPEWMPNSFASQRALVDKCDSVTGVDADLRPHSCGITKVAADIEQLPFPNESFSLVTANMVVEHVANPEKVLREVWRVLAPGGQFLFHTPNAEYFEVAIARRMPNALTASVASLLDGRAHEDIFPTHYRLNTAEQIEKLASKCGLETIFLKHVECTAQGIMLGPLVIPELIVIRTLRLKRFERYRSNLLVLLQKSSRSLVEAPRQT